ncbi:MAG: hypothetical protein C0501_16355 [Isosphaera sp.]|nr:hypothetical protein [Isosphaera sp.]
MAVGRRKLTFATLDEAVADAENLLARGYDRAGNWDLAQCCGHLAEWMRFPMDGFPRQWVPVRVLFWALRNTIGRRTLRKMLATGGMPAGAPTLKQTVPPPGGDAAGAVAELRRTAGRMAAHPDPPKPSPLLGALTRDEWFRVNLLHCAHHLSFLVPRS